MYKKLIILLLTLNTGLCLAQQGERCGSGCQNFNNVILGSEFISNGTINAVLAFQKMQEKADDHYKAERFDKAFEAYLDLAKLNDKYSQYRVSVMYFRGLGISQNVAEAYAWSYISAEARQKGFVNNHVHIRDSLSPEQLDAGKTLVNDYHNQFGTFAIASEARKVVRREKRQCTGSRVGGNCDRVGAFGTACGVTSEGGLTRSCMVLGSVGIPGIASLQPAHLRKAEKQLDTLISHYNPGRVELGDLEIIED